MWRCGDQLFYISSSTSPSQHFCLCTIICLLRFAVHYCWIESNSSEFNETVVPKWRDERNWNYWRDTTFHCRKGCPWTIAPVLYFLRNDWTIDSSVYFVHFRNCGDFYIYTGFHLNFGLAKYKSFDKKHWRRSGRFTIPFESEIARSSVSELRKIFKFSKIILNGWDHNISDHGAKQLKRHLISGQIQNELYEDRLRIENSKRDFCEKLWIYFIRVIATIVNLILLSLYITAVALAATQGKLRRWEHFLNMTQGKNLHSEVWLLSLIISYLVSITLAGTSIIAPFLFKPLIKCQKLRSEAEINQLLGWRVALRFISLITLLVCYYREIGQCQKIIPEDNIDQFLNNATQESFYSTCSSFLAIEID